MTSIELNVEETCSCPLQSLQKAAKAIRNGTHHGGSCTGHGHCQQIIAEPTTPSVLVKPLVGAIFLRFVCNMSSNVEIPVQQVTDPLHACRVGYDSGPSRVPVVRGIAQDEDYGGERDVCRHQPFKRPGWISLYQTYCTLEIPPRRYEGEVPTNERGWPQAHR